jgi:Flp pilus assembly protein TadD
MGRHSILGVVAAGALLALLGGCTPSTENTLLAESGLTKEDPKFFPSDDYLRNGKVFYRNGDFGKAELNYRKAVEVTPTDAEAWLGLAASYDQLRRFELADKAYARALALDGKNPTILNNAGYSQLLRGNTENARRLLLKAYEIDPGNPYIINNLALLGETSGTVKRVNSRDISGQAMPG